ncbi:MAG: MFS transporter [Ruthenibacterium sp.]
MMQKFLRKFPASILAAGVAIQIFTGVPAAWGVFQRSVCEGYRLDEAQASLVFSLTIFSFGIGCVIGGFLQDKKGPRIAGLCGTVLLGAGFIAAAFVPRAAPFAFYGAFSAPVGLGCAFLYPAVMSCAQKWYADKKGFATGIIGAAVGASGAVLTLLGTFLIRTWNIRTAFWSLGIIMSVICGISCIFLENPTESAAQKPQKSKYAAREITLSQLFHTPQYWLLSAAVAFATPAVLLFSPLVVELAQTRGLPEIAALGCIVAGSAASAAGRLSMPWLSDKIGRRATDLWLFAALFALSFVFWNAENWLFLLTYSALTFCYSGEAAVLPAAVTDLFGMEHAGIHYGFVALGMSAGSLAFPLIANYFQNTAARHVLAMAAAAAGFVCIWLLKPAQGQTL